MSEWIDVKVRLPKLDERVLAWDGEGSNIGFLLYEDAEWRDIRYYEIENVSHWMPLPEPPKSESDCNKEK
jgi:hypothetical protein